MHRVRQSLPFYRELGWEAEVIAVDPKYVEAYSMDDLLLQTIPGDIKVHYVKAWDVARTHKFGLGSLSMRSWFQFKKKGNELLRSGKFDLVFFSTTAFHVMSLGPYWKMKYKLPFILDIQDPWRNDFYLDKPKAERPPKFVVSYNIDKYLEKRTLPNADGIISVSQGYVDMFLRRYKNIIIDKFRVIPFGYNTIDFEIAHKNVQRFSPVKFKKDKINVVYIGRGGHDLAFALDILFGAFAKGLRENLFAFEKLHFWFLGTSYAAPGQGTKTILPIATNHGVEGHVTESTDRLAYFETLYLLEQANLLFIPGSVDKSYTASKLYPYILAKKQLLGIFYKKSSVVDVMNTTKAGTVICFEEGDTTEKYIDECVAALETLICKKDEPVNTDWNAFEYYSARELTKKQISFFNQISSQTI
jgi:hypothetical protein